MQLPKTKRAAFLLLATHVSVELPLPQIEELPHPCFTSQN
jgi:hypothetical protein